MLRSRWIAMAAACGMVVLVIVLTRRPPAAYAPPSAPPPTYDLAMELLKAFRVDDAEEVLKEVLEAHPESVRVRDELRWLYFNQFRQRELESLLEDGLRIEPQYFQWGIALLMSEFRPQNPREVLGHWRRASQREGTQARSLATFGYCCFRAGDGAEAERALQTALDLRPDDPLVQLRVAEFLVESGRWSAADELLKRAQTPAASGRDTYRLERLWLESLVAESRGDLALALQQVELALAEDPNELRYVQRRGALLKLLGRGEEAATCLMQANELESYVGRLTDIVLSGELENPSQDLCLELAAICRKRGKVLQAETWNRAARHTGG